MFLVEVWIEYSAYALDRPFTYACFDESVTRGKRVEITFHGRASIGFVESVKKSEDSIEEASRKLGYKLGVIDKVIDEEPLINEELFAMAEWMANETVSSRISCFQAMLPAKLKPMSGEKRIKTEKWVQLTEKEGINLTLKQAEAWEKLRKVKTMRLREWRDIGKSSGKALEDKGLVEQFDKEVSYVERKETFVKSDFKLTPLQNKAKEEMLQAKQTGILLHGVTGSGKTEVYLQMAEEFVKQKKQVLILVPEIGLTPQMVKRVENHFASRVAIYHSGLNNQEKYEQYKRVVNNQVDLVVGTRSAVFMPFSDLGLIIMDEEHDLSYKQDNTPQYHCRDACLWRAEYHHCKVIMGSATPSLDSYARTLKNRYALVEMPNRINETMPIVTMVNTQEAMRKGESYILTNVLKEKIQQRLNAHEQVMLMLNRRGYSPTVRCTSCGESLKCPHCDVALTWHRAENALKCHTCGYTISMMNSCPKCKNGSFSMLGLGTQKLVEEVEKAFPAARVDRMDADTTTKKNAHATILNRLENHETDILVGTQIIAKGIDYPDVTLVGIINGDAGLNRPDYRSVETTFELIVQAAGRSGRASKSGEVVIQAYDPNHYAIQYGAKQDYKGFFKKEMNYRHLSGNPPYTYLVSVVFSNLDQRKVVEEIHQFSSWIKETEEIRVLGPSELFKLQDFYRCRIILKGKDRSVLLAVTQRAVAKSVELKLKSRIKVDTSPMMLE